MINNDIPFIMYWYNLVERSFVWWRIWAFQPKGLGYVPCIPYKGHILELQRSPSEGYWLVVSSIFSRIYIYILDNPSDWLIFFRWVETTNQVRYGNGSESIIQRRCPSPLRLARCHHGLRERNCAQCHGCEHGKLRFRCPECREKCPHGQFVRRLT